MPQRETSGMTEERFAALAAAYGADVGRWPEGEREAARTLAAGAEARRVLAAEADLDHLLWQATTTAPSHALSETVIALAPAARSAGGVLRWLAALGVAGGMAIACAAGVAMGATFAPHALINVMTPHAPLQPAAPTAEETALDGGLGGDV